jgi:peptidylprolyl isomerase
VKYFGKKVVFLMAILLLIGVAAACGPATPPAEEADGASNVDAVSEEKASEDSAASETVISEESAEAGAEAGEQEQTPLDGSFDIYGGAEVDDFITTESGLQYIILEEGDGEIPEIGQVVSVHYTGYLTDGTIFDSSRDRGETFSFPLGQGQVIAGWDEGIGFLPAGSSGRLIIPPELAYGDRGAGEQIQPGATLVFDVELVEILPPPPESPTAVDESEFLETDSGVQYYDIEEGSGAVAEDGQIVTVHFTGWLEDGEMFDSSFLRGQPIAMILGAGQVIPGWEDGMKNMKVGGMRQIIIPPELGFGEEGAGGGVIPPNATLIFEVELVDVSPPQ